MLLIILLFLVVVHKYVSLKEKFTCIWEGRLNGAINARNKNKILYDNALKARNEALKNVREKNYEINVNNDSLENAIIDAGNKYTKIVAENESLKQALNKTTIKTERCESFNKLKLNAIKKIYS